MTPDEAVKELDRIKGSDPEKAHAEADDILFSVVPKKVADAYQRVVDRSNWWGAA